MLEGGIPLVSRHSAWWEREKEDMLFGIKLCWWTSYNNDITKASWADSFLDELAALGIDKGLKERENENEETTSDNESNNEESSSDREKEGEETASENDSEAGDTEESDNDTENDSQESQSSSPETTTTFHSENPCEHCENSNMYGTLIMKCPKCSWHDY